MRVPHSEWSPELDDSHSVGATSVPEKINPNQGLTALTTIGYQGASLDAFLATLRAAGTTLVLDIRERPMSRRKGYSKTALSQALASIGIEYQHERALGAPRPLRQQYRADGKLDEFFVEFRRYLATQGSVLDRLATTLGGRVSLLCFERDPVECHRSVVVAALAERLRIEYQHLKVVDS